MAITYNKTNGKKQVPVKRNNKFFGEEDFNLMVGYATEYLEEHANQTVILYRVDYEKTKVNELYHEAKKDAVRFLTPIELPVIYEVEDSELKSYNNKLQTGIYAQAGKLVFSVLLSSLEKNNCDISRGDYIGVQIDPEHREYYTVIDDGRVGATSNKFTIFGTKPYARTITCASVDLGEFNG